MTLGEGVGDGTSGQVPQTGRLLGVFANDADCAKLLAWGPQFSGAILVTHQLLKSKEVKDVQ